MFDYLSTSSSSLYHHHHHHLFIPQLWMLSKHFVHDSSLSDLSLQIPLFIMSTGDILSVLRPCSNGREHSLKPPFLNTSVSYPTLNVLYAVATSSPSLSQFSLKQQHTHTHTYRYSQSPSWYSHKSICFSHQTRHIISLWTTRSTPREHTFRRDLSLRGLCGADDGCDGRERKTQRGRALDNVHKTPLSVPENWIRVKILSRYRKVQLLSLWVILKWTTRRRSNRSPKKINVAIATVRTDL